ncbi:unnamed protein product, partial [Allacma fusca]
TEDLLSNDELANDLEKEHLGSSCSSNSSQGTQNPSGSNTHSILHHDTETTETTGISITNRAVREDLDSDMDEIYIPPTRKDDGADVIDNLYESSVQQVSVRFRSVAGLIRTPPRTN